MDAELFEIIVNKQTDIILLTNLDKKEIVYANEELERFFDMSFETFKKKFTCICYTFLKQEDYLFNIMDDGVYWIEHIKQNPYKTHKALIQDNDGYFHHFKVYIKKISEELFMVVLNNITNIISIQEELLKERTILRDYKKIVDISTILTKTDTKGIITYANDKFCEISKYSKEELIGKPHNIIRHPDTPSETFKSMWFTIKSGGIWTGSLKNRAKDGSTYYVHATISPIFDQDGNIKEYIAIRKDITSEYLLREELEQKNKKIEFQNEELKRKTLIDSLTDSYNRRGLDELMKEIFIDYKKGKREEICIIMTDIDNFKKINDEYGHDIGDNVLTEFVFSLK